MRIGRIVTEITATNIITIVKTTKSTFLAMRMKQESCCFVCTKVIFGKYLVNITAAGNVIRIAPR